MNNIYGVGDLGKVRAAVALAMASNGHFGDGTNFDGDLAFVSILYEVLSKSDLGNSVACLLLMEGVTTL